MANKLRFTLPLLAAFLFLVSIGITMPVGAANPNADWRALTAEAYTQADLVLRGTVLSVDDQTAVDGGHVYSLQVTDQQKGIAEEHVFVRAGGFFYRVSLNLGESVLVFLKSTKGDKALSGGRTTSPGRVYSLVEAESLTPMVFRVSGAQARPVDGRLQASFASVSAEEIEALLSSIKQ